MKKPLVTISHPPDVVIGVIELADQSQRALHLLGTILATVKLNVDRGHIVGSSDDVQAVLDAWIEKWYADYSKLRNQPPINRTLQKYDFSNNSDL